MPLFTSIDEHFQLVSAMEAIARITPAPQMTPRRRAEMLESIAASLDAAHDDIIAVTSQETALTPAELEPEFARMVGTLRLFAHTIRDGAWLGATIDHRSDHALGPNHDLRRMLVPLGPVAVFGASNFPLAYGVCGGDTASALAAGCPVVVKEHPAHTKTGRLILARARTGLRDAGHDEGLIGYIANPDPADLAPAQQLVQHPLIAAVGFTGSRRAGLAIDDLARQRPTPIPVFAEMGSANPVLITHAAAAARAEEIAQQLADSILARFGQQCTCPGLIFVPDSGGDRTHPSARLIDALAGRLDAAPEREMLAPWIRDAYVRRVAEVAAAPGVKLIAGRPDAVSFSPRASRAAALLTSADRFAWHAELHDEIFGPAIVIIETPLASFESLPLPASLTLTIHFQPDTPDDLTLARRLLGQYTPTAGRIICNGVPTGVRVSTAMVHGGPFPATNRPESTAVGPHALARWCRPVCWQNVPDALLPDQLKDGIPARIPRTVDGSSP